jgi:hypothetical protein
MAYTAPDKTTFTGLFPAFAAVTQEQYDFWSARAARVVDPITGCLADDADLAAMLATAHYLTLQGIGTGAESEMAAQGATSFTRIKTGSIELERRGADAAGINAAGGSADAGSWGTTSYGARVFPMLKACLGGPRVTATGSLVGCGGFNGFAGPLPPYGC